MKNKKIAICAVAAPFLALLALSAPALAAGAGSAGAQQPVGWRPHCGPGERVWEADTVTTYQNRTTKPGKSLLCLAAPASVADADADADAQVGLLRKATEAEVAKMAKPDAQIAVVYFGPVRDDDGSGFWSRFFGE
jgi:hypothetical protein